jgi:hypothetical protein
MKSRFGIKFFLFAILALVLLACTSTASADGTSIDKPADYAQSASAGILELEDDEFTSIDLATALGVSVSELPSIVIAVTISDDDTTTTTAARIGFFASSPVIGNLDGSTAAKTGIVVTEARTFYVRGIGRYMGIHGAVGTAHVSVARVR